MLTIKTPVIQKNLSVGSLIQIAVANEEGVVSENGAFSTATGKRTGRSPKDRYIVQDQLTFSTVDWGVINQPIQKDVFDTLWGKAEGHLNEKGSYLSDLQVGADPLLALPVQVITERAWHNAFCCHMFVKQDPRLSEDKPNWTLLHADSLKLNGSQDGVNSDGAVIINLLERKVLICGISYAGEMKKAMFTVLNYFLPENDVLPMHCAANCDEEGDVALFFGLSGTGKTTLSADPHRQLIGDDEHGWGHRGVFNFEGGCYAKCINLSVEREPVIWGAIKKNAIMENVVLDQNGAPVYSDERLTKNSRCAYPRTHIENRVIQNTGGDPSAVLFLTCDLFGVLPPVSLLNIHQAAYYFLSGYTALVGSTEVGGSSEIQPTFSTCFGAPFFPRSVDVYANLLVKHIERTSARVYLVNTGWSGGAYQRGGERFAIPATRQIVANAISGDIDESACVVYPGFDVKIPLAIEGVSSDLLDPRKAWSNSSLWLDSINSLIGQFNDNFKRFENMSDRVIQAGPKIIQ